MNPLWKLEDCKKQAILDEILQFRNSVMPEHQWIEKVQNIAKRAILWFHEFSEWTRLLIFRLSYLVVC